MSSHLFLYIYIYIMLAEKRYLTCLLEKKNELDSFLFVQIDEYILGLDDILYVTLNDS